MTAERLTRTPAGQSRATLILAHGAGAPMDSDFMTDLATALAGQGIATVRFEFPYMQRRRQQGGRRPPDRQPVLLAYWREVFRAVAADCPGPLLIGGKSMGGRMASLVADELEPAGLFCFGYPFHPPGKPEKLRTAHLGTLTTPGVIIQGDRDPFARGPGVRELALPPSLTLHWLVGGDHDFKPLKRSGLTRDDLIARAAAITGDFVSRL